MKKFLNNTKWQSVLLAGLTYTPLEPLPGEKLSNGVYAGNFSQLIGVFFNVLLSIGAMIAVVTLVLGGITYMVSEIVDKKTEARKRMQTAIMGLLLLLTSWLILHEINPNLTQFNLQLTNSSYGGATGNSTVFIDGGSGSTQNIGNPANYANGNPYGFSSLSTAQQATIMSGLSSGGINCNNWVVCYAGSQYINYDPANAANPDVQTAINNFKSNCESFSGNYALGKVQTIDGSLVGASGQTALVCQLKGTNSSQ